MPFNPSTADMASAAKLMAEATEAACGALEADGQLDDARRLNSLIANSNVRQLAYLHHFITVPQRGEG